MKSVPPTEEIGGWRELQRQAVEKVARRREQKDRQRPKDHRGGVHDYPVES